MKKFLRLPLALAFSSLIVFSSCDSTDSTEDMMPGNPAKPNLEFYALSNSNQLIKYNANAPETAISTTGITGVTAGDKIIAIDFRPATGQLYGLGLSSRLYMINYVTGAATAIGAGPFSPAINGTLAGFDFNPTVDRIRIVTNTGQNLRVNPETGAVTVDGVLNPGTPTVFAAAYTNSVAGASTTSLFVIDYAAAKLYKQNPPNNGVLVEIGSTTVSATPSPIDGGFDISPDNTVALATLPNGTNTGLYRIDTATGKAQILGNFASPVIGLAIPTGAVGYTVDNSNNLQIFNLATPGTVINKPIAPLQAGETILGIDMRPATGQLYALGSSSRLYSVNLSSGATTVVGTAPFSTPLNGTTFGVDFNPTVDRLRIVSNTGQNLRINPNDGAVAGVDLVLNPGTPAVSGVAYTNNFAGATTTVLYDIDATTDKLYTQNPPNNGVLIETGPLNVNVTADNGFDIGGTSGKAYAVLTVGSTTGLYTINLTTGAATLVGNLPNGVRGFTLGLGF